MTTKHDEKKLITITMMHLTMAREFQVRGKLDEGTINRYVGVLKSGKEMPPVKVAKVDGVLILVDGFHRVEAKRRLGEASVVAEVVEATKDEARWMAARANLEHGLPLKNKEIRDAFRVFVRTKQYINEKPRGSLKPYSEIAQVFGKSKGTIWNWMKDDFPSVAARYSGEENFKGDGGLMDIVDERSDALKRGLETLLRFTEVYQETTSSEDKSQLVDAFSRTARDLLGEGWKVILEEDF